MQFHLLLIWHLTASFFPATRSISERSRATRSRAPKGQNDSKEIFKNETRTERVVAGATCKDKCTQINTGSSTELQHGSLGERPLRRCRQDFSGHRIQPVSNGLLWYNWVQGVNSMSTQKSREQEKHWARGKSLGLLYQTHHSGQHAPISY